MPTAYVDVNLTVRQLAFLLGWSN